MKNKKWNRNDWQGRSEKQVIENYRALNWIMMFLAGFFLGWSIWQVIKHIING